MTRVIVLKEKYCNRIFDASTKDKLHKVALSIVKARFGGPRSSYLEDQDEPIKPDVDRDKVDKISNKDFRRLAADAWVNYDHKMQLCLLNKEFKDDIRRCIKEGNGRLAMQILESRASYEYENFSIEDVLDVYPE